MTDFFLANFPHVQWRVIPRGEQVIIGAVQRCPNGVLKGSSLQVSLCQALSPTASPLYETWQQWACAVVHQLN